MWCWSQISSQSSADVAMLLESLGMLPEWDLLLLLGLDHVKGSVTLFLYQILLFEETNSSVQLILGDSLFHADACSSFVFRMFSV